jgi:hypothetical protein
VQLSARIPQLPLSNARTLTLRRFRCTVEAAQSGWSCALLPLLPAPDFRPTRINARKRAGRHTPVWNLHLGTAFRSLEKTTRYRVTFTRSILLACPFGSSFSLYRTRSIHPLVHAAWLAPCGADSSRRTRCPIPSVRPCPFSRPTLPLRAFTPFPIKALA